MDQLMLSNQAIARGAWEAGVRVVSPYPGTPSTEITEAAAKLHGPTMHVEWAPMRRSPWRWARARASAAGAPWSA